MGLAWACGFPHYRPMLEAFDLTPGECAEAEAFAGRVGLPDDRADVRAAMLALVTARVNGAKGVTLADFLPDHDTAGGAAGAEQTPADMDRQLAKIAGLFEATDGVRDQQTRGGPHG